MERVEILTRLIKKSEKEKMRLLDKVFGRKRNTTPNESERKEDDKKDTQKNDTHKKARGRVIDIDLGTSNLPVDTIGIDLGTSNSSVAVIDTKTGRPVTVPITGNITFADKIFPSCVAFTKDGEILIGEPAKRQAITNPEGTVMAIKRKIGTAYKVMIYGKEYTPQQIEAFVLRKIKQDAEAFLGMHISRAVVTVPAYFNDCQRQATKDACTAAGMDTVRIISEPTAAALACRLYEPERPFMVFHIGGGTVDVTMMVFCEGVFEVISTSGDTQLGGIDMDNRIIDYITTEFKKKTGLDLKNDKIAMGRLREAAEASKIELSSATISNINLPYISVDRSGSNDLDMTLTREKLEELVSPIIEKLKIPIDMALKDAKLIPKDVGRVILVGEPTHMPIVEDTIRKYLGSKIKYNILHKEYVAMGAAIQAGVLTGEVKDVVLLEVTPLSLGIETLGGVFTKLIERNTTIPTKKGETFSTAADNQTSVEINVLQGEREFARDNTSLGRFHLMDIPPAPRGVPQIEVTFDIDSNGMDVSAKDLATGNKQDISITSSIKLSKEQIDKMREETERFAENCKLRSDEAESRYNAESLIYRSKRTVRDLGDKISKEQKEAVENYIMVLRKALESNDLERLKRGTEKLKSALQMEERSDEEKFVHSLEIEKESISNIALGCDQMEISHRLEMSLPIIVETMSEVFAKVYENGRGDNNFNLVITPNSRVARLYARVLSSKGLKESFIHIGIDTPDSITIKKLESLKGGRIHHFIGNPTRLSSAFESYPMKIPTPPYLRKPNATVNLWLIEPEVMDYDQIEKALLIGLITKNAFSELEKEGERIRIEPNQTIHLVMSKETMNTIPKFKKILSDFRGDELNVHIINAIGIMDAIS